MTWSRKFSFRWSNIGQAAAAGAGTLVAPSGGGNQTREITADQLTGGRTASNDNNSSTGNNNGNGNTNRPRRTRRPRRTPSQVSTTSLPAYMKEPGEQEVVIFRGPADMEDVPISSVTAAVEMPTVAEDGDSENSVREQYTPMPDSPHDMPLLQNDEEEPGNRSSSALVPPTTDDQGRRSVETSNYNSEEGSSLARVDTALSTDDIPDPRGAAPAYFEVVDLNDISASTGRSSTNDDNATTTTPATSNIAQRNYNSDAQTPATSRRSFRISNIFGRSGSHRTTQSSSSAIRQPVPPPPGIPLTNVNRGHNRNESAGGLSLTTTVSRSTQGSPATRSRSRISVITNGHRPSQSSSSLLSLVNPLHRKKSTVTLNSAHLTSPSLISLNSISAPLSHTLVKTEITYPRSGPTPEQLKLISSRETFARFGLPYGDEAVRWAKSRTELVDDGVPPPEFEEIAGASSSSGPSGSSGNDDGRSSNAAPLVPGSSGSSGNADAGPSTTNIASPEVIVHAASKPPSPRIPSPSIPDTAGVSAQNGSSAVPSSPLNKPTPSTPVDPTSIAIPDSPPNSPTSTVKAKSLPSASPTEAVPPVPSMKPNTNTKSQPPSAFRTLPEVADPYSRAESRASSFRSFATANESLVSEFGERTTGYGNGNGSGTGSGGGGGGRSRSRNAGTYDSTRSETPALSIAESRYYTDYDEDEDEEEGSTFRLGAPGDSSDSGTDSGMETETEDERRERRLTVRAAA
ncbi:hypothetical protein AAF712_004550 [Marasmius tenuissimus]|uniref:Uncharacterized protein n=1 Tax=Marasmius tenuissimus TaxID=585030 RepID=A0ABR3A7E8_9AGAR